MNFLLSINPDQYGDPIVSTAGFTETLLFGLMIVAIGMLTVFSVLVLIWFALSLFKKAFAKEQTPRKKAPIERIAEPVVHAPVAKSSIDDLEIIAVIAAAVAMAEQECGNGAKFRVVSFKRK